MGSRFVSRELWVAVYGTWPRAGYHRQAVCPASKLPPLPDAALIERAMLVDRPALRTLRTKLARARRQGHPHDRNLRRMTALLRRSVALAEARGTAVPAVSHPPELPISGRCDEIAAALRSQQVLVVCGETGCGKSTQLPKLLLSMGHGVTGAIGHTQPRRLAARSLARRVADELGVPLGNQVGYRVRFGDQTSPQTLIKLMTDGMLLAETRGDRSLLAYDALILDEAHERSLNIDFLLGYLVQLLPRRPELRLVITSATIEPGRFAQHFARAGRPAPVIEVAGRSHPVELRWRPLEGGGAVGGSEASVARPAAGPSESARSGASVASAGARRLPAPASPDDEPDLLAAVADALAEAAAEGPGDVLVFLPTERHIHEAARLLRGRRFPGPSTELLPLYARLSPEAQQRLFTPHEGRRVVLATNLAETSLTVPGISTVIDTGTARVSRWSPRARMRRLPIEPISQASANQRMGRCGRVGPGLCLRLYAEQDFLCRPEQPTPEIQRSNLARVVLAMADLDLGPIEQFPFLDPPRRSMVAEGVATLTELGALDADGAITPIGTTLARLPVDPRIGRMLVAADAEGCLSDVLIIAAALETADPRRRPPGKERAARSAHGQLLDGDSDFMSLLLLWDHVHALRKGRSRSQWFSALEEHFLSPARCREWIDLRRQLGEQVREAGLQPGRRRGNRHAIGRAVLSGLISYVAWRKDRNEYRGADGKPLWLWPGSALFDKRPRWIVAAEVLETSRRWARSVARVDPSLIEELAGPLLERSYRDPWWERRSGHVLVHEKLSLFGLPLVPRRRARYDRVEPVICRELFLRHALAEGQLDTDAPFLAHNLALANELAALEARTRVHGLLADLDARYDFYDRIVPAHVVGAPSFQRWRRRREKHDPQLLFMSRADLLRRDPGAETRQSHPDQIDAGGLSLPLSYRFEPGTEDDGVTARVGLEDLPRVDARRLQWLVPGLLREKCIALMRSLPKPLRRLLVPIPTRVEEALALLRQERGGLHEELARALQRLTGQPIVPGDFDLARLPESLAMRVEVLDDQGRVLAAGRDLKALREQLGQRAALAEAALADPRFARDDIVRWDFGALPESIGLPDGRRGYPALVDRGDRLSLCLMPGAEQAASATRAGVLRLLRLALRGGIRHRLERRADWQQMQLWCLDLCEGGGLCDVIEERSVALAFDLPALGAVRDAESYGALLAAGRARLPLQAEQVGDQLAAALCAGDDLQRALHAAEDTPLAGLVGPLRARRRALLCERALRETPPDSLPHLPRYLRAMQRRLERVSQRGTAADAGLAARVRPWEKVLAQLTREAGRQGRQPPTLDALRWMLEEFRVSVFAQELGTAAKVSEQRLARLERSVRDALAG